MTVHGYCYASTGCVYFTQSGYLYFAQAGCVQLPEQMQAATLEMLFVMCGRVHYHTCALAAVPTDYSLICEQRSEDKQHYLK